MCGNNIPALWWTSQCAQKQQRSTRRTTHRIAVVLSSPRPSTTCKRPRHKTNTKNIMQPTTATNRDKCPKIPSPSHIPRNARSQTCRVFTGCAEAPCHPMRLPLATCISQAALVRIALRVRIKGGAPRLARKRCISHIILASLHCLPVVRGGKREHVRFSAGL